MEGVRRLRVSLFEVPDSGHYLLLEQSKATAALVKEFLQRPAS